MELVHQYKGEAMTEGFEVFPIEVEKPKRKRKVVKGKTETKRKAGRPRVYNGTQRRQVAAALKKYGLTKGIKWLAEERKLKVSITLARAVAKEAGIQFEKGRPKAA